MCLYSKLNLSQILIALSSFLVAGNCLDWPSASDMNTRLRRLIAGYQRIHKKQQLKKAAAEKERERKERFEEAVRQKEQKKLEMAQK